MRTIYKIQGSRCSEWVVEKETEKCLFLRMIYPNKSSLGTFRLLKSELGKQQFRVSFTDDKDQAIKWLNLNIENDRFEMSAKEVRYKQDMERLNDITN